MKILKDEKYFNDVYENIIRKAYKCTELTCINKLFNLSEDEFVKLCLSKKVLRIYNKLNNFTSAVLIEKCAMNYELMIAIIIRLIEKLDDDDDTYICYFRNLSILNKYKNFFYIFPLIQITNLNDKTRDIDDINKQLLFIRRLKYLCKNINDIKYIEKIIFDDLKEFFLYDFDWYIRLRFHKNSFIYIIEHINTYKMLDERRKEQLYKLAEYGIFYKEHAEYLSKIGDERYISEMIYKSISGECIVV